MKEGLVPSLHHHKTFNLEEGTVGHALQDTTGEQQISSIKKTKRKEAPKHITLSMFEPDALQTGKLDELVQEYFGFHTQWVAAYANPESEQVMSHEERKKERYLKKHPDTTVEEYSEIRYAQLKKNKRRAAKAVNNRFYSAVQKNFEPHEAPSRFADRQLSHASEAMEYTMETLYPDSGIVKLRNEAGLLPISPAKTVERISSTLTDPVLQREEVLRHLLAHTSAELERRNNKFELDRKLAKIQALLNRTLYEEPHASTEAVVVKALYDDETNNVEFIDRIDGVLDEDTIPTGKHIKDYELSMRTIRGTNIRVYTNPDIKEQSASIVKAVRKTQEVIEIQKKENKPHDDNIKAEEYVHDTHRILFAVEGGPDELDFLVKSVKTILEDPANQNYLAELDESDEPLIDNQGKFKGRVIEIKEDSKTNGYSTQSKEVKFTRLQLVLEGLPVPVELKFQDMKHFLKDEFHVGEDGEDGMKNGAAHTIYKLKRARKVQKYFMPVEQFTDHVDLESEALRTQRNIVFDLRNQTRKVNR